MSKLSRQVTAAIAAIDRVESAAGASPSDRAFALAQLRNRVSDAIVRLSHKVPPKPTGDAGEKDGA